MSPSLFLTLKKKMCKKCEDWIEALCAHEGLTVEIDGREAVLIQRKPSWSDNIIVTVQEPEGGCEQVNAVCCTWVVDIQGRDKWEKPFRTARRILEYHSCGYIPEPTDNIDDEDNFI